MSVQYRYVCKGCGTWFNQWYGLQMQRASYPVCPTCGTDYYVSETCE